mgnify:CR=1 FL=1
MTVIAAIPARYAAARLPGKLLLDLGGKPIIAHVVEVALRSTQIDTVLVATDHDGIAEAARLAGAEVAMTDPQLPSGSDRIGRALRGRSYDLALNIQGDEPEMDPLALDQLISTMRAQPKADIGTLSAPLEPGQLSDPNAVKVVCDHQGFALYFSRAPIGTDRESLLNNAENPQSAARRHVGVYAYRKQNLERFLGCEPSALERRERLEQLRALEMGMKILVVQVDDAPRGIDTEQDLIAARRRFAEQKVD